MNGYFRFLLLYTQLIGIINGITEALPQSPVVGLFFIHFLIVRNFCISYLLRVKCLSHIDHRKQQKVYSTEIYSFAMIPPIHFIKLLAALANYGHKLERAFSLRMNCYKQV